MEELTKEEIMTYTEDLLIIPDKDLMLTTYDNPYNPKVDYDKWRNWDIDNDYCTEALIDRLADIPPEIEDPSAIHEIMLNTMISIAKDDPLEMYKLV